MGASVHLQVVFVLFAGNQIYRAITLAKAPDYDVESFFWTPEKSPAKGAKESKESQRAQ